jgi:DNA-binding NtrC family response regulator
VLVAEEEPSVRDLIGRALSRQEVDADFAEDAADAAERLHGSGARYSAIVVDLAAIGAVADLVDQASRNQPPVPVIALADRGASGRIGSGLNGLAFRAVVEKPVSGESLRRAIESSLCNAQPSWLRADDGFCKNCDTPVPSGGWRSQLQPLISQVAATDVSVLIRGETGVGKDVLAREIHALSARARKPFLKVNCAALPSELIRSELFGYDRGACKTPSGTFETADGGTVLLDEIAELDSRLQARLVQVLQDSEPARSGPMQRRKVDVRVIATTNCDLERAIQEGRFREGLYYRLNIISLHVPALRERQDEILPLANLFLRKHAIGHAPSVAITPALQEALLSHDWPGNVRELENVIRKLLVLQRPDCVAQELQSSARRRSTVPPATVPDQEKTVAPHSAEDESVLARVDYAWREAETKAILAALNSTLWNRKRAAEVLNIDYKALLYKMKKLGIAARACRVPV